MRRVLAISGVVVLLGALFVVATEFSAADGHLELQPTPPDLVVDRFGGPRGLQSGWWYEKEGVGYEKINDPRTVVAVVVSTYRLVALRQLLGYLELKPAPSFPNYELEIDSPELVGVGFGVDAIQCGDGQPDSCSAWVYWSVRGNQIAEVTVYVDLFEGRMTADEFREMVRSVLALTEE